MPSRLPNILYLHSHDTGRYVQPYGHPVPTPNIQRLADQGLLFRQAFCGAPTCSGSRAVLLTGQWAHVNGMIGLAHRGFRLHDYRHHLVHTLRGAGYWSGLVGEQHLSVEPEVLGYDAVGEVDSTHVESVVPATRELLAALTDALPSPTTSSLVRRTHGGIRRTIGTAQPRSARTTNSIVFTACKPWTPPAALIRPITLSVRYGGSRSAKICSQSSAFLNEPLIVP